MVRKRRGEGKVGREGCTRRDGWKAGKKLRRINKRWDRVWEL